jgi:hypothetical protein
MRHLCLFLIFASLIAFVPILHAQEKSWNLLLDKKQADINGDFIIETDFGYVVLGIAFDTFPTYEQGITISLIDKKNSSLIKSVYFEIDLGELDFDYLRKISYQKGNLYFPMFNFSNRSLELFIVTIPTLEIRIQTINYTNSIGNSKGKVYIQDFIYLKGYFYLLANYFYNGDTSGQTLVLKINSENFENSPFIIANDTNKNLYGEAMISYKDGILISFYYQGTQVITGGIQFIHYSLELNKIWEYNFNTTVPNWGCQYLLAINEADFLYVSTDPKLNYSTLQVENRFSVMRFNSENNKSVWYTWWNEPRKSEVWFKGKIVKGFKEKEYLLMANDIVKNDSFYYTTGKIVKFNDSGQRIWQKTYYFTDKWAVNNHFNDIIKTSDNAYLVVGSEYLERTAWLVKIDEDGNILPIDTTSSTGYIYSNTISLPEIKVYPNPASNTIIINQGEISDMTYLLTDIHGLTIKSMPLPDAHHHVVWDISDVVSGTYVLQMRQGDKSSGRNRLWS